MLALEQRDVAIGAQSLEQALAMAHRIGDGYREARESNSLGVARATPGTFWAASEWGGLWRSTDNGLTWAHVPGHVPVATVESQVLPVAAHLYIVTSTWFSPPGR